MFTLESGIKLDDVVTDEGGHKWSQVCNEHADQLGDEDGILDEGGHGICGVKNCQKESDYYLDM